MTTPSVLPRLASKLSKERFQGCLVGAAVGDCLGAPFEFTNVSEEGIQRNKIFQKLKLDENGEFSKHKKLKYTGMPILYFNNQSIKSN